MRRPSPPWATATRRGGTSLSRTTCASRRRGTRWPGTLSSSVTASPGRGLALVWTKSPLAERSMMTPENRCRPTPIRQARRRLARFATRGIACAAPPSVSSVGKPPLRPPTGIGLPGGARTRAGGVLRRPQELVRLRDQAHVLERAGEPRDQREEALGRGSRADRSGGGHGLHDQ